MILIFVQKLVDGSPGGLLGFHDLLCQVDVTGPADGIGGTPVGIAGAPVGF
ncbi:hypothetical protein SDC9_180117 [bioreactor metagenome]|uniref:Uncharacterized protein n=1 Tax=bioreactor metagenome TaxID=1076179 RepID=A0A645H0T3_9ZZZZ